MATDVSPQIVKELAPSGRLRVAINFGNLVLAQKDPKTGEPRGVSVALAEELARRLGVPIDMTTYPAAGKVFAALTENANAWDVAFLAIDPVRAKEISFSPPYVVIEGVYVVDANSRFHTLADVDSSGVRIAVGKGAVYDLYLTRALKHATRVEAPTTPGALDLFLKDKLDAAAGIKQGVVPFAKAHPGLRVIEQPFMTIEQAVAIPKSHAAASGYIRSFIEEMKASGFVAKALAASGQDPTAVAPPASPH